MKSLLAIALAAASVSPCLWDSDTLDTELRGLPEAFDLVIGRWHRHSDAYYTDRVTKLGAKPKLELADYDDLAVAYEHLDKREAAIEAMARKAEALAATPDSEHQYRYHANLGTFYAHAGRFDEALAELRTAVGINPDAHFGRERFQIDLIEYVAAASKDDVLWRARSFLRHSDYYMQFVIGSEQIRAKPIRWGSYEGEDGKPVSYPTKWETYEGWNGTRKLDWDAAHKAVCGMLRFGGLEGAELYRALGELYLSKQHLNLAWYAYGRAIERGHPAAEALQRVRSAISGHWDSARPHTKTGHVNPTDADYVAKRAAADAWLARFQALEAAAIRDGVDVRSDEALKDLLARAESGAPPKPAIVASWWTVRRVVLVVIALLSLIGLFVRLALHWSGRREVA